MSKPRIKEVRLIVNYNDGRGTRRTRTLKLPVATNLKVKARYILEEEREFDIPIEFEDGAIAEFFEVMDTTEGKFKVPDHLHESFETCAICQTIRKREG